MSSDLIKQKKSEAAVLQQALMKNRDNYLKFIKQVEAEEKKTEKKKDKKLIKEKVEEVQKLVLAENKMLEELKPLMAEIKKLEGNDIYNNLDRIQNTKYVKSLGSKSFWTIRWKDIQKEKDSFKEVHFTTKSTLL